MAKATGLAWTTLSVDTSGGGATDIRNDITDLNFSTPRGIQDITGIDKSAKESLLLLADFSISLKGVFNVASSHTVFATISSTSPTSRTVTIVVNTATLPNECNLTDYQIVRSASGELTWTVPGQLADGTAPTWA